MRTRVATALLGGALVLSVAGGSATAQEQPQEPLTVNVESIHVPSSYGKLVRPGVRVTAGCNANCLLVVDVNVHPSVAAKLQLSKLRIARAFGEAQAGTLDTMHARVKPRVADRLRAYTGSKGLEVEVQALP